MVSLPLTILNSPAVSGPSMPDFGTAKDIAGIVLWSIGWVIETLADIQKVQVRFLRNYINPCSSSSWVSSIALSLKITAQPKYLE